jgi:hypothetical protein
MFQHDLQWCGVVVCSAVDVCCVCCAFSSSHGRTREGGERRGGGKIICFTLLLPLSMPYSSSRQALLVRSSEYRVPRTSPFFSQKNGTWVLFPIPSGGWSGTEVFRHSVEAHYWPTLTHPDIQVRGRYLHPITGIYL